MVVAGDSAGGNMATVVALMAKKQGGAKIAAQILLCPVTDAEFNLPSYQQFASGYMLSGETMRWFWDQYAPDQTVRHQPTASPLKASLGQLKDLPQTLIITAECDVLRDEGEAYARKLNAAGVAVLATRYLGTIHGFVAINALVSTLGQKAAIAQVNAVLRNILHN